jgi:hypothetical protein
MNRWKEKIRIPLALAGQGPERTLIVSGANLDFFNRDGVGFAYFNAGFAAEAFFGVHGNSLAVLHFKNLDRTNVHAFAVTVAFVNINRNIPSHSSLQSVFGTVSSPLFLLQIGKNAPQLFSLLIAAALWPVKSRMQIFRKSFFYLPGGSNRLYKHPFAELFPLTS